MTREKPHVLIVGGGIGGLTLALALHARDLSCRVYEAAPEFRPLGVGINMLPHAIRELTVLGLQPALEVYGVEAREFAYFNRHGQAVFAEPCGRFAGYEYPHFSIHRADLHRVLADAVMSRLGPDAVRLGHRCIGVEQDAAGTRALFEDARAGERHDPCRGGRLPFRGAPQLPPGRRRAAFRRDQHVARGHA